MAFYSGHSGGVFGVVDMWRLFPLRLSHLGHYHGKVITMVIV